MAVLILQSANSGSSSRWIFDCIEGVRAWATAKRHHYRFLDDDFFKPVPTAIVEKLAGHSQSAIILSDLARLHWCRHFLSLGYERVVWLDADVLVFAPDLFDLPSEAMSGKAPRVEAPLEEAPLEEALSQQSEFEQALAPLNGSYEHSGFCRWGCHVGREHWLEASAKDTETRRDEGGESVSLAHLRVRSKLHNAFLSFSKGSPLLDFYLQASTELLLQQQGNHIPAQFVGPKLLSALHRLSYFPVFDGVGMISPRLLQALMENDQKVLRFFKSQGFCAFHAANLCSSLQRQTLDIDQIATRCRAAFSV